MALLERPLVMAILVLMTSHIWPCRVDAFNIDVSASRIFHGQNKSLFGYNVALWSDMSGNQSLVVGAPRGSLSTAANHSLPLGNVYLCQPMGNSTEDQCVVREDLPRFSTKDYSLQAVQWAKDVYKQQGIGFGETLFAPREERTKLLVCASRYPRNNVLANGTHHQLQTRGACFVLESQSPDVEAKQALPYPYSSLNTLGGTVLCKVNDQSCAGYAQAGFSAAMTKDMLFIGAPSAFRHEGVTVAMKWSSKKWRRDKATKVSYQGIYDNNMEGWATVVGRFNGTEDSIATSSPGHNYRGMVKIYKKDLQDVIVTLTADEVGSWFGFVLGVGDFNGDKKDDLAVGAPYSSNKGDSQDYGKVYIYYSPKTNDHPVKLEGHHPWARFGESLTCSDLNLDGYDDLAVGAPYTFDGTGSVFIYNGAREGIKSNPSQTIHASDFPFSLKWFGFSLAGGLDFDGNGYPDLLVGAPGTDKALFLRSGPVISLTGGIEFESPSISMDDPSCTVVLPNGIRQEVVCFNLLINLQYKAKHLNDTIPFRLSLKLDHYRQRLAFVDTKNHLLTTIQNVSHVDSDPEPLEFQVYLKPSVRHLNLTEIVGAELQVSIAQTSTRPPSGYGLQGDGGASPESPPSSDLLKYMSDDSETSFSNTTSLRCSDITVCITRSDLVLTAKKPEPLVVSEGTTHVDIALDVKRNTAYSVTLNITAPSMLKFLWVEADEYIPECDDGADDNYFTCHFPTEIPRDVRVPLRFTFKYHPTQILESGDSDLHFSFVISSDALDLQPSDNSLDISIPVISKVNIEAHGWSEPGSVKGKLNETLSAKYLTRPELRANISHLTLDHLGPEITHKFKLVNHGPSPLIQGKIVLGLPLGDVLPLLYLVSFKTSSNLYCSRPILNPLNLSRFHHDEVEVNPTTITSEGDSFVREDYLSQRNQTEEEEVAKENGTQEVNKRRKRSLPTTLDEPSFVTQDSTSSTTLGPQLTTPATGNSPKKETMENQWLRLNCNNINCMEIECDLSYLMARDDATIEISGYLTIGFLQLINVQRLQMESSLALYTSHKNVSLNDRLVGNDENHPESDTRATTGAMDTIPVDEHTTNANPISESMDLNSTTLLGEEDARSPDIIPDLPGKARVTPTSLRAKRKYDVTAATYVMLTKNRKYGFAGLQWDVDFWTVLLGVMAGLMLLIIICAILFKVGFFNRKRSSDQENEDLPMPVNSIHETTEFMLNPVPENEIPLMNTNGTLTGRGQDNELVIMNNEACVMEERILLKK